MLIILIKLRTWLRKMNIADGAGITRYEMFSLISRLAIVTTLGFFSMKWIMTQMDPMAKAKKKAKEKVNEFCPLIN